MVAPSDQIPLGLLFEAPFSVSKSFDESLDPPDTLYAYSLSLASVLASSATHIVTPSDHMPCGLLFVAAFNVSKSRPGTRPPSADVVNDPLTISSELPHPAALNALNV